MGLDKVFFWSKVESFKEEEARKGLIAAESGSDDPLLRQRLSKSPCAADDVPLPDNDNEPLSSAVSWIATFWNLSKSFAGAASFELPWAVAQAGLVGGVLGVLGMAALSYYSLILLPHCGHLVPHIRRPTYPQIAGAAFGIRGEAAAWIALILMTLGVCGAYLVFIGARVHCDVLLFHCTILTYCPHHMTIAGYGSMRGAGP